MKKWTLILCLLLFPALAAAGSKTLYIYNWTEYMPDEVLSAFQEKTGIRVVYSTYDSNESMYAKVKLTRGKGYDLVFPSTYFVHKMRREGLLSPIDHDALSNFRHLDPVLLDKPYDPGNRFSIPYVWGSTALAYNSDQVAPENMTSWKDLWRPEFKNRLVMNDDVREVLGVGLIINGFSVNETDPDHIRTAYESIRSLMPNIRVFSGDSPKQPLLNLEAWAGMVWNGEAYMAAREFPAIRYAYPEEGAIFWVDSMVIPTGAENKEEAHAFIDFILEPENAVLVCEYIGYAPANRTAVNLMPDQLKNDPTIFPALKDVKKGGFQTDVGDAILVYERYWERLKTGM
ncbi:MAG: spermidine/putrescine ABC transporter substrate-binding protein [Desulfotignum sp.]|nr:spermidine/putrescine ABC transporter substrate-binding protein [Desulfotignum sp.]MCF8126546.1 spermidine/putrescine ABC transporter substrate-binding protein [Desulfotignum sp.]